MKTLRARTLHGFRRAGVLVLLISGWSGQKQQEASERSFTRKGGWTQLKESKFLQERMARSKHNRDLVGFLVSLTGSDFDV